VVDSHLRPFPPSRQYEGWLEGTELSNLFQWALSNRDRFKPAKVTGGVFDPGKRMAEKLGDLGPHRSMLERRLREHLPEIFRDIGTPVFAPDFIELELVAHGEGAFFVTHTDIPIGSGRKRAGGDGTGRHDRLVSAVYYFHREPKRFSGGALRLYRLGDGRGEGDFAEFHPAQNSLVAFPSWVPHEVRRVSCPGGAFEDCRFALNIWLCRERGSV
jgi:hypothetical protein